MPHLPWWRHAVCYQVYVRSFADSDGDGVGDLAGITSRLPYLADLGVDAVWLTPFYRSPQADHGYDVADYCDVDPLFGDLAGFDALVATAHEAGLRVIVDIVPNHTSDQHRWFQAALAAPVGSPERRRYLFRDGRGPDGSEPPNNWLSMFGGPAWSRVPDGQWYLHLFEQGQPDLDWTEPEVADEFDRILRFWLDRGVDGFRIDVAHGMAKADGLPDLTPRELAAARGEVDEPLAERVRPYDDQPAVHDIYRRWHRVLAEYPGDRMAIGEAWVADAAAMARYLRPDELQQTFNFHWVEATWSADALRQVLTSTLAATDQVGASPTWVLSNHDVVRTTTRLGAGGGSSTAGNDDPDAVDTALGLTRARAALLAMLVLPGSAYLYQGEELGLPQVAVPPQARQDPIWLHGGGTGRDGCRVPLPWTTADEGSAHGFSPPGSAPSWLPQPAGWGELAVDGQQARPGSTLELIREALALRRRLLPGLGERVSAPDDLPEGVFVVHRPGPAGGVSCVVACGSGPVDLAGIGLAGAEVLLESEPGAVTGAVLGADRAAWFRTG